MPKKKLNRKQMNKSKTRARKASKNPRTLPGLVPPISLTRKRKIQKARTRKTIKK